MRGFPLLDPQRVTKCRQTIPKSATQSDDQQQVTKYCRAIWKGGIYEYIH